MKFFQFTSVVFLCCAIISCSNSPKTYEYYMQHPNELRDNYKLCTNDQNPNDIDCKIVEQAAQDFFQLVEDRSNDPEGFGLKIMNLQMELSDKSIEPDVYQQKLQKLQAMYAVIAATSME